MSATRYLRERSENALGTQPHQSGLNPDAVGQSDPHSGPVLLIEGLALHTELADLYVYFGRFGEVKLCAFAEPRRTQTLSVYDGIRVRSVELGLSHIRRRDSRQAIVQIVEREGAKLAMSRQHWLHERYLQCSLVVGPSTYISQIIADVNSRKAFVFGLKKSVGEEYLRRYFGVFGPIENARIVRHRKDNRSKGFGFVVFRSQASKKWVMRSGPFVMEGKQIKCVPFSWFSPQNKRLFLPNEKLLTSVRSMSWNDWTTCPSTTHLQTQLPQSVGSLGNLADLNYRFNRSRIISSAAADKYFTRRQPETAERTSAAKIH